MHEDSTEKVFSTINPFLTQQIVTISYVDRNIWLLNHS